MKRFVIVRHAKATHQPGFADPDRPLTGRGRRDAEQAGAWLRDQGVAPDLVLCSPARRTRETWERLSAVLDPSGSAAVDYGERLYLAPDDALLELAAITPDDVATLLLVGHNPAAQQLAAGLTGRGDLPFPTSAIAVIGVGSWARLTPGAGTALGYWTPGQDGR